MFVVGITGSFGTGKTTVAAFFRKLGAKAIDADRITHKLLKVDTSVYKAIVRNLGKAILKENREIDRHKLADIVFREKKALNKLNRIIHPQIIRQIKSEVKAEKQSSGNKVIVIDAPLLTEAGLLNLVDKLVVVIARRSLQVSRIIKAKGLSRKEIAARIRAQLPLREKIKSADYVVDNNGSLKYTEKQVREIWDKLTLDIKDVKGLIRRRASPYDLCHTSCSINRLLIKGG